MKALKEMLTGTDSSNKISSMRVAVFMVLVTILGTYIAHNVISMTKGEGLISLGWNEVIMIASILGTKVAQHFSESKSKKDTGVTMTSVQSSGGVSTLSDNEMPKG